MMMTAVTGVQRRRATRQIFDTVHLLGGWIDDIRMCSNLMNTFRFTLRASAFRALTADLREKGISVDHGPELAADQNLERMGTLAFTFVNDETDLRRDVPAVPS
jgi:hypothetical protein